MNRIKPDSIFLIDGSSILYRSYYGLRPLHTSSGAPTQATYGFCRAIKKLIDDYDPKNIVIAWDSKGKTFRKEMFSEYKATRQAAPSDLFTQKEDIVKFANLIKINQISKKGYEADDLIYSIVKKYKTKNFVIIGPDKDLHQLISDNVLILDPLKKEIIDENEFKKRKGFGPEKLAFYHSIVGDSSDNIPGVKGIGKKGATDLVKKFDSLKDLYQNIDKVKKERTRNLLLDSKDNAFLSLELFKLKKTDFPSKISDFKFNKENWSNANSLFIELEFKSLVKGSVSQTSFIEETNKKSTKNKPWKCHIIRSKKDLEELVEKIKTKKQVAIDTETTGLFPLEDKLVGISLSFDTKNSYYIPLYHEEEETIDIKAALKSLDTIFKSKSIKKILHNTKFDQLAIAHYGSEINNITFDTLIAANLLRKEWSKIGLKKLSISYLSEEMKSFKDVLGKSYENFSQVPISQAATYAAHDALQTFKLSKILSKDLNKEKKLKKIFETIEMPLSQVLFEMEKEGIALDTEILKTLKTSVNRKLSNIEKKIFAAIEHKKIKTQEDINLNSPKQIEVLLFDELKLPVIKKSSKGKRSTDQEVLRKLREHHPIPGLILQHRELFKLKSTYIEALPSFVNNETKRIHTSFSQTMVATGRLSSSSPNLQNIPASGEIGIKIREAFIAKRGKQFISADYSQIELRVLAQITKDKNLIEAFLHNEDIHSKTAAQIFEVDIKKVTHEQRQIGKRINFSIIYGQTPYGLSKELGIKQSEAKNYIEKYFDQYPKVKEWISETVKSATKKGFAETMLGRKRYIPGLRERNRTIYEAAKRIATNSPIQGTSAELMKMAMINIRNSINKKKLESRILLQIHDELIIESPNSELETMKKLIKKEMESVANWKIPLTVDIRTGKNWAKITK